MLGAIIAIAPFAVQLAETIFRKLKPGEKTGGDKLDVATQILRIITAKLATTDGNQPTDDVVKAIIETSLTQLKQDGLVPGGIAATGIAATEAIYLIYGGKIVPVKPVSP